MSITDYFKNANRVEPIYELLKRGEIDMVEYDFLNNFSGELSRLDHFSKIYEKVTDKSVLDKKFPNILDVKPDEIYADILSSCQESIEFSKGQQRAIKSVIDFLLDKKSALFGIYGYAGTGKTTLLTKLVMYLLSKRYVTSVALVAPTNKAVNVIKSKFQNDLTRFFSREACGASATQTFSDRIEMLKKGKLKIEFCTIHKLLDYQLDVTADGTRTFVKKSKKKKSMTEYDFVIIDECSMIPSEMVEDICSSVSTKLIFVGDPAQLPPVNESMSSVFTKNIQSYTLTDVVRADDDRVINFCNEIRFWVMDNKQPEIQRHDGGNVKLYRNDKKSKFDSEWFKKCADYFKSGESAIILAWTNRQCDAYNEKIRQLLFGKDKMERFEIGDILLLNDFYNISEQSSDENNGRFYTSEQIIVDSINSGTKMVDPFVDTIVNGLRGAQNFRFIEDKFKKCVTSINKVISKKYHVWKLGVKRPDSSGSIHQIYVVKNEMGLEKDKRFVSAKIDSLRKMYADSLNDQINRLEQEVIKPLWQEYNKKLVDQFAKVNYGASISVHKSQASTFRDVFVDVHDILKNRKDDEAKRCFYTAATRTSNELHILL